MKNQLDNIQARMTKARRLIDSQITEAKLLASRAVELKEEIVLAEKDVELYNKVAITLASIGEQRQLDAQNKIEELISRGLTSIFSEKLDFKLVQSQRGKTPEVKFYVHSRGLNGATVQTSVMDARGGGMAAIVGFLLRLAILLLSPGTQMTKILILDESFSHVSAEYERPLAEFIKELVDKTQVSVILITHSDAFTEFADTRYEFKTKDGITQVREF